MTNITAKPGDVITVVAADAPAGTNATKTVMPTGWFGATGGKRGRKASRKASRKENNAVTRKQAGGKKKMGGYFKFMQEERSNIMKQHPKFAVTEVAKEAGKRWRALSDSEKAKY